MKASNEKDRRRAKLIFSLVFGISLIIIASCGAISIVTAQKGIALLENKKVEYDDVFKKQAELNFRMEELFRNLNSLRTKPRNTSEHKHMQKLITQERLLMESDIADFTQGQSNYDIYQVMLEQVKSIQAIMDELDRENKKRDSNIEQLEKCRTKYQELTKSKVNKP